MLVKLLQLENAYLSIRVTPCGITTLTRFWQSLNASPYIILQPSIILHDSISDDFALTNTKYGFVSFPK